MDNKHRETSEHASDTLVELNQCRKQEFLCDFTIRVQNKIFPVHRVIVAACSGYFRSMFSSDMREVREGHVDLKDVSAEGVEKCIEFMYTGNVSMTLENCESILHASTHLQLSKLTSKCCTYLLSVMTVENCIYLKQLATIYSISPLMIAAEKFAQDNFKATVDDESFKFLSHGDVIKFISQPDAMRSVFVRWKAVLNWTKGDEKSRKQFFPDLLQLVRLEKLPMDFLKTNVRNEPLVKESDKCRDILLEALFNHDPDKDTSSGITVVDKDRNALMKYDPLHSKWNYFLNLPEQYNPNSIFSILTIDDCLYVVHGRSLYSCSMKEKTWHRLPDMIYDWGQGSKVMSSGKSVFLFGDRDIAKQRTALTLEAVRLGPICEGAYFVYNPHEIPVSGEIFDTVGLGTWTTINSRQNIRTNQALASDETFIYFMGGSEREQVGFGTQRNVVNYVQRFDPRSHQLLSIQPMSVARADAACACHQDFIYIMGGVEQMGKSLMSAEIYNIKTNSWASLPNIPVPMSSVGSCAVSGKIYVIGGGKHEEVMEYDVEKAQWSRFSKMSPSVVPSILLVT